MPEISELQERVFKIITDYSEKGLFGSSDCELTNQQIFEIIPDGKRPSEFDYITTVLKRLEVRKKISLKTKFVIGRRGLKRVITIL